MTAYPYCARCCDLDLCHTHGCVREVPPAPSIRPAYVRSWRGVLVEIGLGLSMFALVFGSPLVLLPAGAWEWL